MTPFHFQTGAFKTGAAKKAASKAASTKKALPKSVERKTARAASRTVVTAPRRRDEDGVTLTDEPRGRAVPHGPRRRTSSSLDDQDVVRISFQPEDNNSVTVVVEVASGDQWLRVPTEATKEGLERLFSREALLERTAIRYGLSVDALLATLEESAVDISDESAGVPDAELQALQEAGIDLDGTEADPTGVAQVALGQARYEQFRNGALTVAVAADLLGKTPGRVRQMLASHDLLSIPGKDGQLLPAWQFHEHRHLPGLDALAEIAEFVHPLTLQAFMFRPDPDLEINGEPATPFLWLLTGGNPEPVAELATGLAIPA